MVHISDSMFSQCEVHFLNEEPALALDPGNQHRRRVDSRHFNGTHVAADAVLSPTETDYHYTCAAHVVDEAPLWLSRVHKFDTWDHERIVRRDTERRTFSVADSLSWREVKQSSAKRQILFTRSAGDGTVERPWHVAFEPWELSLEIGFWVRKAVEPAMRAAMKRTDDAFVSKLQALDRETTPPAESPTAAPPPQRTAVPPSLEAAPTGCVDG